MRPAMSGPGGIVSVVKAWPTFPRSPRCRTRARRVDTPGAVGATALQVAVGTPAAAFVGAILSIELTSSRYRSRRSDRRGLRHEAGLLKRVHSAEANCKYVTAVGGVWRRRSASSWIKASGDDGCSKRWHASKRAGPPRLSGWRESALAGPIDHRGSVEILHWRRCLCALIGIGGNALLSQIGRHPAPLVVSADQAASSTSQKIASATTRSSGRGRPHLHPALIVQPDLDRGARGGRRVSRILYFGRSAGNASTIGRGTFDL